MTFRRKVARTKDEFPRISFALLLHNTVTVKNEAGEEFRRNAAFIKKYNKQDGVSRPNGKEDSLSEEIGQRQEVVSPAVTGVS